MRWGCKLIISHGVVEKEKNEVNETQAQHTSTFFSDCKKPRFAREDTVILIIEWLLRSERRQSFSYLGHEGELRKTHQRSKGQIQQLSSCTSREGFPISGDKLQLSATGAVATCDDYIWLLDGSHGAVTADARNFRVKSFS
jgi:hypothetical protein